MKTTRGLINVDGVAARYALIDSGDARFMVIVEPSQEGEREHRVLHEHAEAAFDVIAADADDVTKRGDVMYLEKVNETTFERRNLPGRTSLLNGDDELHSPQQCFVSRRWVDLVLSMWGPDETPPKTPTTPNERPIFNEYPLPGGDGPIVMDAPTTDAGKQRRFIYAIHAFRQGTEDKPSVIVMSQLPGTQGDIEEIAPRVARDISASTGRVSEDGPPNFLGVTFLLHYAVQRAGQAADRIVRADLRFEGDRPIMTHRSEEVPLVDLSWLVGEENVTKIVRGGPRLTPNPLVERAFAAGLGPSDGTDGSDGGPAVG